jgi:hypothetical protein
VNSGLLLRMAVELACGEAANERRARRALYSVRRGPPLNPTTASMRLIHPHWHGIIVIPVLSESMPTYANLLPRLLLPLLRLVHDLLISAPPAHSFVLNPAITNIIFSSSS